MAVLPFFLSPSLPPDSALPPWLSVGLFLGASAGHIMLLVAAHNWCYGGIVSRPVSGSVRLLIRTVALGGPVVFWWYRGFDVAGAMSLPPPTLTDALLAGYLLLCCVLGLGMLPVLTAWRCLRRPPAALASNHTTTVDVAAQLGRRPIAAGRHSLAAHLPFNEIFQVDFTEKTLHLPQLPPAWEGLTVLHLSDLHMHGLPDRRFFQHVVELCNAWEPDLVALTGDIVDTKRHHRWVVPVLGRLRWRVAGFAILGNHDSWYEPELTRRRLRRVGFGVLGNGWQQTEVRGVPLVVIGHEGPWFPPEPDLSGCPSPLTPLPQRGEGNRQLPLSPEWERGSGGEGVFRLCLSHTPDHMPWARRHRIDLMLAGHVHGGQIRIPPLGSVFVPSIYGRRYDCGLFHEPPTLLHVSRGVGGEHPLRFNCRPEVTKLVLRRG
jgi:uncharacterized protein